MKTSWLAIAALISLSACTSGFQVAEIQSRSAVPTDPTVGVLNPVRIQPMNRGSEIILGFLHAFDVRVTKNRSTRELVVRANIRLLGQDGTVTQQLPVDLKGTIDNQGSATLHPLNERPQDLKVRARVTCLADVNPADCDVAVIDFFAKVDDVIHAAQIEADLRQHHVPTDFRQRPPEQRPPEQRPPEQRPPEQRPPEQRPPEQRPPEQRPPEQRPPEQRPPEERPPEEEEEGSEDVVASPPQGPPTTSPRPRPRPAPQAPAEPEDDEEEREGVDSEDRPSLYIGTLHQGADDLFEEEEQETPATAPRPQPRPEPRPEEPPAPNPPPPAVRPEAPAPARPRDQAIGSANQGSMQNATNLKDRVRNSAAVMSQVRWANPGRETAFGTYELVEMVEALSRVTKNQLQLGPLLVGNLSQRQGGRITGTRHRSHQNGLDADLGYPVRGSQQPQSFTSMVRGGRVVPDLNLDATWSLFENVYRTGAMDRIFVDQVIKRALCERARSRGLLDARGEGSAKELLRRLRPEPGHANHFHLRIKCSVHHPRCRMMGDPPAGSGC